VSACLFVGWLGFLFYLWWNARTVVLSKPQFLIAQAYVVAEISPSSDQVVVKSVLWPDSVRRDLESKALRLPELSGLTADNGYHGAGTYLLPLVRIGDSWTLARLPRSTFYSPPPAQELRIYIWNADVESQVNELIAAKK
jgi:hypothetical protein